MEITGALLDNQSPCDRPDIVAHIFKLKLQALLHDLYYGHYPVLGKMSTLIYVVEWQKRGLPHAHILAICNPASKPQGPEDYDKIVCAEIPHSKTHPSLHAVVTKFLMHRPCGVANPKSPCMIDGKCSKNFQRTMSMKHMQVKMDIHTIRGETQIDVLTSQVSCWITNMLFHITHTSQQNIMPTPMLRYAVVCSHASICTSMSTKGPDMASVALEPSEKGDEIKKFVNSRFITASQSMWRFFKFDAHGRYPSVQCLAVHKEDRQTVVFKEDRPLEGL